MKALMNSYSTIVAKLENNTWLVSLLTRFSLASVFMVTGWGKLHSLDKVTAFFVDLGIPFPAAQAQLVACTEFVGGILILLGLFTRLAAIPLSVTMVVAIATAKKADIHSVTDFFSTDEFIYIVLFMWLIFKGGGCFSLDALLKKMKKN